MPSLITTIKRPEIIQNILKKEDFQADEVIMLSKDAKMKKDGYKIISLEGAFHEVVGEIKNVFEEVEEPYFIASEDELDLYVTYYLTQFQASTPLYVLDEGKPVFLPVNPAHRFGSTKIRILELLTKNNNITFNHLLTLLSRSYSKSKGKRKKYSESTIHQYLQELENMGLIDVEVKRNKKYSINENGIHFIEHTK
jgi:DNA-binding transcriptional ArsR family regulator